MPGVPRRDRGGGDLVTNCSHSLQSHGVCSFCLRAVVPIPGTVVAERETLFPQRLIDELDAIAEPLGDDRPGDDETRARAANRADRAGEQLGLIWGES